MPEWLPFDLVAVERADERVRDRILQTPPMPKDKYLALKLRLEDELITIAKTISTLEEVLSQADMTPTIILTPALASYVEDFYSGCERLAERIVVTFDGGLPDGQNWHQLLLQQVAESGRQRRPPLWNASLLKALDEYRRFHHRVRHLYNIDLLDDEKVLLIARQVPVLFERIKQAVAGFSEWLEAMAEDRQ